MRQSRPRRRRRLFLATEGVSTIEFAIVAPVITLLIIGILDFGRALWEQIEVGNAARSGAAYVEINSWNATDSGIGAAIDNATGLSPSYDYCVPPQSSPPPASPPCQYPLIPKSTLTWYCGCPNTTSGITSAPQGSTCADGTTAGHYITIGASASFTPILAWPGMPTTLTATATARLYP